MNKKRVKILLIALGGIITLITFLLSLIEADFSIANAIDYYFEELLFIITLESQSILTVMGPLLITIGLIIDTKNKNDINNELYIKRKIKKYKILRIIGLFPFIIVICSGIFSMFNGYCFFYSCSYGLDALFETILLTSLIVWPLYIIGIILIVNSKKKLKELEKK